MNRFVFLFCLIILVFLAGLSWAGIPKMINYQGMLTQLDGVTPVTNENYPILFKIYNLSSGGDLKWSHTYNVLVTNGLFNVVLGDSGAPIDLPFDENYWLEIAVAGNTLSPRTRLTSVGYTYRAEKADTANYAVSGPWGGNHAWTFLTSDGADTTLRTGGRWGIARYGNVLYGNADSTHVNLGVASTTGTSGQNYKYCTVGGGRVNTASDWYAIVGGGADNTANGAAATVGGGQNNIASHDYATVGGGFRNAASGDRATVGGGQDNTASTAYATVGGGWSNTASNSYATVGGGSSDTASGHRATVAGGGHNTASGDYATVGGGALNTASGDYATVGGGDSDTASGYAATIGGGKNNTASNWYATVGGGNKNSSSNYYATIAGGQADTASGYESTVGGGNRNVASGGRATIGGGGYNTVSGDYATVGGGKDNTASGDSSTIGGGTRNTASDQHATVSGGTLNTASDDYATVGGGYYDTASGYAATVGGGRDNAARGWDATIGGGYNNTASGTGATVGGGYNNVASGPYAAIPGGDIDSAAGTNSFAAGRQVTITSAADYTFAFGRDFTTSTPSAVIFYHTGEATRMGINKTDPTYAIHLPNINGAAGKGMAYAWNTYSSVRWKENINPIDHALNKVLALRGVYFDSKESKKHDIGMIAEEVGKVIPEVVSYEENGKDAQGMDYARLIALLVEAMKEQQVRIDAQQEQIDALKDEIEKLKSGGR